MTWGHSLHSLRSLTLQDAMMRPMQRSPGYGSDQAPDMYIGRYWEIHRNPIWQNLTLRTWSQSPMASSRFPKQRWAWLIRIWARACPNMSASKLSQKNGYRSISQLQPQPSLPRCMDLVAPRIVPKNDDTKWHEMIRQWRQRRMSLKVFLRQHEHSIQSFCSGLGTRTRNNSLLALVGPHSRCHVHDCDRAQLVGHENSVLSAHRRCHRMPSPSIPIFVRGLVLITRGFGWMSTECTRSKSSNAFNSNVCTAQWMQSAICPHQNFRCRQIMGNHDGFL